MNRKNDTIAAIATGVGGAIAIIRVSGERALSVCDSVFKGASGLSLVDAKGYTMHYGQILRTATGEVIDDVIVSVYRGPRSYTGEDMAEISCHGSGYIQREIMQELISHGARSAQAGEFTQRAFLAGKLDLSQAEAVADIIASTDRATHLMASNQMRGGYSAELASLRGELLELAALLELELDFSEEDVEFADRSRVLGLISRILAKVGELTDSFSTGNAIKEGIAVAIVGSPNVGKSTLLNAFLRDDRAMVSDIPGTTRDVIEESVILSGMRFRFLDTAGIRDTDDKLEQMGIVRTRTSIAKADIVLLVVEPAETQEQTESNIWQALEEITVSDNQKICVVLNKSDKLKYDPNVLPHEAAQGVSLLPVSAKHGENIETITEFLTQSVDLQAVSNGQTIVSHARHLDALLGCKKSLIAAQEGLTTGLPTDLTVPYIREALFHLGTITGEITTDEILGSIFSKFCIGK